MAAERRDHSIAPPHPLIVAARTAPAGDTAWSAIARGLLAFGIVALLLAIAACTVVAIMLGAVLAVEWLR